jgi:hypothetical protein
MSAVKFVLPLWYTLGHHLGTNKILFLVLMGNSLEIIIFIKYNISQEIDG